MKFVFIALILLISQAQSLRFRSAQIIGEGGQITVQNEFVATPQANNKAQTNTVSQVAGQQDEISHSFNSNFDKSAAPQQMKVSDVKTAKFQVESLVTPKAGFINQPAPIPTQAKQEVEPTHDGSQETLGINVQNTFQPMSNNQAVVNLSEQIQEQNPVVPQAVVQTQVAVQAQAQAPVSNHDQIQTQFPDQVQSKSQSQLITQVPPEFQNNLPKVAQTQVVNDAPVETKQVVSNLQAVSGKNVAPVNNSQPAPVNNQQLAAKIPTQKAATPYLKKPVINISKGELVEAEDINNKTANKDKKQFVEESGDSYTESGDNNKIVRASGDAVSTYDVHPEFYKVSPIMVAHLEEAKN